MRNVWVVLIYFFLFDIFFLLWCTLFYVMLCVARSGSQPKKRADQLMMYDDNVLNIILDDLTHTCRKIV
jgi:hypothetical protein